MASTTQNNLFSYSTYSNTNINNNSDSDNSDNDFNDYQEVEINELNRLDRPRTKSGGTVIPRYNYPEVVAYKQAKKLAFKQQQQQKEQGNSEEQTHQQVPKKIETTDEDTTSTKRLTKSEVDSIINLETEPKEKFISSGKVFNRIKYDTCDEIKDKIVITYQKNNCSDRLNNCSFKQFDALHLNCKITEIKYGTDNQIVYSKEDSIYDFSALE